MSDFSFSKFDGGKLINLGAQSSPIQTISGGTDWKQVSGLGGVGAAIKTDGTLWMWGRGRYGVLGNDSTTVTANRSSPVQTISSGTSWCAVSSSSENTAAIKNDNTLWIWGRGDGGSHGNNSLVARSSPVQTISGGTNWCQVSIVSRRSSAIKTDGTLWLWGYGRDGRLGNNSITNQSSPVQTISGGTTWKQASLAYRHSAAIKTDGTLWLWGNNRFCSLGIGNFGINRRQLITTMPTRTNFSSDWAFSSEEDMSDAKLSNSGYTAAAIKTNGSLWLWGSGLVGQLGNNKSQADGSYHALSPVQTIAGGTNWKQVSLGYRHSSAIKTDGTLWLWGCGTCGILGINNLINQSSPVQTISGGTNWKQVSLGSGGHSAAIKTDGTLWAWGRGTWGALGNNSTIYQSSPVQTISGGTNWKQVSIEGFWGAGAIKTDGTLWLWGRGAGGILGNNSIIDQSSPVQTISGGTNWKQVSKGACHFAAIKTDGTLWMWGCNSYGSLGNGIIYQSISSPIQTISGGTNWKSVSAGYANTSAIKTDGTLWVWGLNSYLGGYFNSVLGTSSCDYFIVSPSQTIAGGTNWKDVASGTGNWAGVNNILATKSDNTLWNWGPGYWSTGATCFVQSQGISYYEYMSINKSSPVQTISGGTNWKQVSLGSDHSSAIKTDGTLWLWGYNCSGELGAGFRSFGTGSPIQTIIGGTNWDQVAAASSFSSAIKTDGTLWLWGYGRDGRLGNNSLISQSSPVQTVARGTNWCQISMIGGTAAIKTDGTLWVWGSNYAGALANGYIDGRCKTAPSIKDVRCYTCSCIPISIGEGQNVWGVPEE
jgi:alpha-tubulin suppressor-like RCC1 family protein